MLLDYTLFFARQIHWILWPSKHRAFFKDYKEFTTQYQDRGIDTPQIVMEPTLNNKNGMTFDGHYMNHPYWAYKKILGCNPSIHIDISSYLPFVIFLSAHIPVLHLDFNPPPLHFNNLYTGHVNITNLPFEDQSIDSLSCMHVVEHIGLGRYGDLIDIEGDIKAMKELQRVTAPSGNLYFVVPVGKKCIYYNAHRIYDYETIINTFNELTLVEFSMICQKDPYITYNADPLIVKDQIYACGLFHFRRSL